MYSVHHLFYGAPRANQAENFTLRRRNGILYNEFMENGNGAMEHNNTTYHPGIQGTDHTVLNLS